MDPVHSLILRIRRRILREEAATTLLLRWWRRERAIPRPRCRHCGYRYTHMCLLCYKERCLTIYNEYYGSDDESATTSTSVGGVGGVY